MAGSADDRHYVAAFSRGTENHDLHETSRLIIPLLNSFAEDPGVPCGYVRRIMGGDSEVGRGATSSIERGTTSSIKSVFTCAADLKVRGMGITANR